MTDQKKPRTITRQAPEVLVLGRTVRALEKLDARAAASVASYLAGRFPLNAGAVPHS